MKIEIKRIEYSEKRSKETYAFSADLYIDDIKVGTAFNPGDGRPNDINCDSEEGLRLMREASAYFKTLPEVPEFIAGEWYGFEMTLGYYIDKLMTRYLQENDLLKFRWSKRAMNRAMLKGFVIGVPDNFYIVVTSNIILQQIMSLPNKPEVMANLIKQDVIPRLVDGKKLLNTNIPESILKLAGLVKGQYQPNKRKPNKQAPGKGKGI